MKRGIIAVVLVLSMLLTSVAYAAAAPQLALGDFTASAGSTKLISLAFDKELELAGFQIELIYDADTFEIEDVEFADAIAAPKTKDGVKLTPWDYGFKTVNGKTLLVGAVAENRAVTKIADILIATKSGAKEGTYEVAFGRVTVLDADMNIIAASTTPATAKIQDSSYKGSTNADPGAVKKPTPKPDDDEEDEEEDKKPEDTKPEDTKPEDTDPEDTDPEDTTPEAPKFNDVAEDHWAAPAINKLAALGVVSGVEEGVFAPDQNVTRAQFVKLLVVGLGLDGQDGTCEYSDVVEGDWFYSYVAAATKNGIVKGNDAGEFEPNKEISRQDMAVMVYRAGTLKGLLEAPADTALSFADADEVADYAKEAVAALVEKGIINGVGDNMFAPNGTATRAMASKVIADLIPEGGSEE